VNFLYQINSKIQFYLEEKKEKEKIKVEKIQVRGKNFYLTEQKQAQTIF